MGVIVNSCYPINLLAHIYYHQGGHFPELSSRRTSPGGSLLQDHPEIPGIPAILGSFGLSRANSGQFLIQNGSPDAILRRFLGHKLVIEFWSHFFDVSQEKHKNTKNTKSMFHIVKYDVS